MAELARIADRDAIPQDIETEKSVLGALVIYPEVLPQVAALLRRADFYSAVHGTIYEAICSVDARSMPVDIVTIADELRAAKRLNACGGMQYLAELAECCVTSANVEAHARIVADAAHRRRVIVAAREAIERAQRGGQTWVGDVSASIGTALSTSAEVRAVSLASLAGDTAERIIERRGKQAARGVSLVLRSVRDLIPSGVLGGQFVVVAALPGCGKSTFMFQVALVESRSTRGESPCRVLYFSKEMDAVDLAERALCAEAAIDGTRAATGKLGEDEARALYAASQQLERTRLSIDDRAGLTLEEVRARCLREKAEAERRGERLTLVCIDYLQLMAKPKADTEALAIERLTGGLKNLARELGAGIIAASQLNRESERNRRRPQLSDLRGSGGIGQDADKVVFIHGELDEDGKPREEVEFIVAKQRYGGGTGIARARFVRELTVFRDLEDEQVDGEGSGA